MPSALFRELRGSFKHAYYRQKIAPDLKVITQAALRKQLSVAFPNATVLFEDARYYLVSLKTMRELIQRCWVKDEPYVSELFDCENFASLFQSIIALNYHLNNVGIVINYTGQHAFNLVVVKEGLWALEPQSGQLWPAKAQPSERYKIDGEIILI